jgi:transcriptional antiterminator RfaH
VNPRSRVVRPFFPGYLFLHEDLSQEGRSTFKWLPFSYGLLSFGDEPGRVPDAIIQALKRRVEKVNEKGVDPLRGWKKGDALVVRDGPFEGIEAIFDIRLSGHQRARILVKFLNDQWVKTEVDIASLENITRH